MHKLDSVVLLSTVAVGLFFMNASKASIERCVPHFKHTPTNYGEAFSASVEGNPVHFIMQALRSKGSVVFLCYSHT
jgi:hypothetical protein